MRVLKYKEVYEESLRNFRKYLGDLGYSFEEEWNGKSENFRIGQLFEVFFTFEFREDQGKRIVDFYDDFDYVRTLVEFCKKNYKIVPYIKREEYNGDIESYIKNYIDFGWISYE